MYIVTGASSGIGRAAAKALIRRGCDVTVTARRLDRLQKLEKLGPGLVRPVCADLGSEQGIDAVVAAVADQPTISGVVHCAGSSIVPRPYSALDPAALAADLAVHVGAPIALNSALASQLAGGRIVYIDSYSATSLREGWSGYSIVKAAAQMAARAAASELHGVTVIRLFPGGVRTALVEAVLASPDPSPAVETFRTAAERGELSSPDPVGEFISSVLLDATDEHLAERPTWDFTKAADRDFAKPAERDFANTDRA